MRLTKKKLILVAALLGFTFSPIVYHNTSYTVNAAKTVEQATNEKKVKTVKVTKNTFEKTYQSDEGVVYKTVKYVRPILSGKTKAIKKINNTLKKYESQWKKNAESNLDEAKNLVGEFGDGHYTDEVYYKVKYNKNGYISIFFIGYEYSMGAHGLPYFESHTFDLNTGKELVLKDIMKGSDTEIKKKIIAAFQKLIKKNPDEFFSDAEDTLNDTVNSKIKDFYLTKNGIVFYYGPYALAPYSGGLIEASIPFTTKNTFQINFK